MRSITFFAAFTATLLLGVVGASPVRRQDGDADCDSTDSGGGVEARYVDDHSGGKWPILPRALLVGGSGNAAVGGGGATAQGTANPVVLANTVVAQAQATAGANANTNSNVSANVNTTPNTTTNTNANVNANANTGTTGGSTNSVSDAQSSLSSLTSILGSLSGIINPLLTTVTSLLGSGSGSGALGGLTGILGGGSGGGSSGGSNSGVNLGNAQSALSALPALFQRATSTIPASGTYPQLAWNMNQVSNALASTLSGLNLGGGSTGSSSLTSANLPSGLDIGQLSSSLTNLLSTYTGLLRAVATVSGSQQTSVISNATPNLNTLQQAITALQGLKQ
ncbi:hypothetical protein HMN09_01289900 [Mycena chlorophos]|uniref:Uncharacterized protein n=1 Tax=Mycena chlorophos TaxID=658473 RepID=A0A8H6VW16_MYCCL|nr:hypothetical protein HMN09_01289900 [Mycena chlorophos]